ncbi:hypothetical protein HD806DRAFT_459093 [Xylariaceae sp. AK1471]|nr:hypothetical protein HD806DRAFT_459093 [Xylariaceae sp. AK1471]
MADPLSVIGAAGAVANIIDVVCKTISTIRDLHERWQDAEFNMLNVASQLVPFKNSLVWIQEWLETSSTNDPHHQFTMDLDITLQCCQLLVNKIESYTDDLSMDADGQPSLEARSKMRAAKNSKTLDELQKMIDRQTNALSLLLLACGRDSVHHQGTLLSKSSSRKVFQKMQQDSASLFVHVDQTSIFTRFTDNLSKLSWIFGFDSELVKSGPYERALRSTMKTVIRRTTEVREGLRSKETVFQIRNENWSTEAVTGDAECSSAPPNRNSSDERITLKNIARITAVLDLHHNNWSTEAVLADPISVSPLTTPSQADTEALSGCCSSPSISEIPGFPFPDMNTPSVFRYLYNLRYSQSPRNSLVTDAVDGSQG